MSVYVYAGGQYHPLEGNQIVSGGQMVTLKASDAITAGGRRYTIGPETQQTLSGNFYAASYMFTSARVVSAFVGSGGFLRLVDGTVDELDIGSGGIVEFKNEECFGSPIQIGSEGALIASSSIINAIELQTGGLCNLFDCTLNRWEGGRGSLMLTMTTIDGAYIRVGGILTVSSGGTANSTTVNSGGSLTVLSGGTANSTTVNNSGRLYVSSGGLANSTTVSGGTLTVPNGGTANATTLITNGNLYVSSGGLANSITVKTGGHLTVTSGGTALNVIDQEYGSVSVSDGGIIMYANNNEQGE